MQRWIPVAVLLTLAACGGGSSPTTPSTTTTTTTRIINLLGSLNIGNVSVGSSANGVFQIRNDGNSPLTVTGISSLCAGTGGAMKATFTAGAIAPATQQSVTVTFTPTAVQNCNGTVTVASDATSGTNTLTIVAAGTLDGVPIFAVAGFGNTVFNLPTYVARLRATGHFVDKGGNSNFIVQLNGSTIINEILRQTDYDGISLTTGGGVIAIVSSGSISWTFTEVR